MGRLPAGARASESSAAVTDYVRQALTMGEERVDLSDGAAVSERVRAYVDLCRRTGMPASMTGVCAALGTTMAELSGNQTPEVVRAAQAVELTLVTMAERREVRDPVAIFLLKNWFGYRDVRETAITGEVAALSLDDMRRKYGAMAGVEAAATALPEPDADGPQGP